MVSPLKLAAGVKFSVPSALIVTVPFGLEAAVTLSGSPSGSLSLPSTLMPVAAVSSLTVTAGAAWVPSSTASGASLTAVTSLMCTVATDETAPALSVTVKVTALTGPL